METVNATEPSGQAQNTAVDGKQRLSRALFELNLKLASCKSGALVQVRAAVTVFKPWMGHQQLEQPLHAKTAS